MIQQSVTNLSSLAQLSFPCLVPYVKSIYRYSINHPFIRLVQYQYPSIMESTPLSLYLGTTSLFLTRNIGLCMLSKITGSLKVCMLWFLEYSIPSSKSYSSMFPVIYNLIFASKHISFTTNPACYRNLPTTSLIIHCCNNTEKERKFLEMSLLCFCC